MNNQNTRRGNTQPVINKNCHSKFNLESHRFLLSKVRSRIKYGMTGLLNNGGFTLIELLVVVLIIGILAAVAVPQYKKVVLLSKAAEAKLIVSEFEREVELYLLTNGWPSGTVMFSGRWNSKKINFMEGHGYGAVEQYGRQKGYAFWAECSASRCYLQLIYCPNSNDGNPGYDSSAGTPRFQFKTTRTPSSPKWQHECSRASVSSFCQSIQRSGW